VLDTVALEQKGIPTVTLAHDLFESAAYAQARLARLPDLTLVVTPRPRPGSSCDQMLEEDPTLVERVMSALQDRLAE
jgi:hypothetical protein